MLTEADGMIIHNYPDKVYTFTNVADQNAATQYVAAHATVDYHLTGVFTPNADGEGSHANLNTLWYISTSEDLDPAYFTRASLSAAGQAELDAILAEQEAMRVASAAFIAEHPPQQP